jgi:predicted adenylyl cyclase CyaB
LVTDPKGKPIFGGVNTIVPEEAARAGENLELKARIADLEEARELAAAIGAVRQGTEEQVDQYFSVPAGRLKLRRSSLDGAHLIVYQRPDDHGARVARFHRLPVADPDGLEAVLSAMFGRAARVAKQRDVWWWQDVRIHLDRVQGLGSFVEFEARLDRIGDPAEARRRIERLGHEFGITAGDAIAGSYGERRGDDAG